MLIGGPTASLTGFENLTLTAAGGASDALSFANAATITMNSAGGGSATSGSMAVTFSGFDTLAGNAGSGDSLTVNSVQSANLTSATAGSVTIGGAATSYPAWKRWC